MEDYGFNEEKEEAIKLCMALVQTLYPESHVPRNKGCMVHGGGTVLEGVAEGMAVMVEGGTVVEGVCRQCSYILDTD